MVNLILLGLDIFLFMEPFQANNYDSYSCVAGGTDFSFLNGGWFFGITGIALCANDLIYLILLPMLLAKINSEKMAQNSRFQRICYAGTVAGVVLALCTVGQYLFSENLASFLTFLTGGLPSQNVAQFDHRTSFIWKDLVALALLVISNLVIFTQIKKDFRQTACYKSRCGPRNIPDDRNLSYESGSNEYTMSNRHASGQAPGLLTSKDNRNNSQDRYY